MAETNTCEARDFKDLEELLNAFDGLRIIETSEGGEGELAYVLLEAKEDKDLLALAQRFAKAMAMVIRTADEWLPPLYYVDLSIEYTGGKDRSFICLSFSPFKIREVTKGFHDVQIESFRCNKNIPQ